MAEEKEEVPSIDFKDIPLSGTPLRIKLDSATHVKSGQGKFGTWHLWFGHVENTPAYEGRKPNQTKIDNYSGKVIFFPTAKLNEQLEKLADGKTDAVIDIHKEVEETQKGLIKRYKAEKISEGTLSQSSLTTGETKLLEDVQSLLNVGQEVDEKLFLDSSQEPEYGQITIEKAKELYKQFLGDKK